MIHKSIAKLPLENAECSTWAHYEFCKCNVLLSSSSHITSLLIKKIAANENRFLNKHVRLNSLKKFKDLTRSAKLFHKVLDMCTENMGCRLSLAFLNISLTIYICTRNYAKYQGIMHFKRHTISSI